MPDRLLVWAMAWTFALTCGCATERPPTRAAETLPERARVGPRKSVAVARFDATGAFVASYGGVDVVGGGLAAMLTSALEQTESFIVVDRADLGSVLDEQELSLRGLTAPATVVQAGRLVGAQVLIRGSITEFDQQSRGRGVSIGTGVGAIDGAISPRWSRGRIAVDFKIVDTLSARVIDTLTLEKEVSTHAIATDFRSEHVAIGSDAFQSTPLGEVSRSLIDDAVRSIVDKMADLPWRALVAKVNEGVVYVNAGAEARLGIGDRLQCSRVVDEIRDPVSQELLGVEEAEIGSIVVTGVQERYSTARFEGSVPPQVGDVLRYPLR